MNKLRLLFAFAPLLIMPKACALADEWRGYDGIGGEAFLLLAPVLILLIFKPKKEALK